MSGLSHFALLCCCFAHFFCYLMVLHVYSGRATSAGAGTTAASAAAAGQDVEDDDGGSSGGTAVPAVRAVALSADGTRLLVGTQTCEILEYVLPDQASFATMDAAVQSAKAQATQIVCGHFKDEVWGLAVRPLAPGDTGELCLFEYAMVGRCLMCDCRVCRSCPLFKLSNSWVFKHASSSISAHEVPQFCT